ncbi:MAG: serine hydroxymethyltransferase [Patescibacteria group bacterium]
MDRIQQLIQREFKRQKEGLELIPSENYASKAVRTAMGSILTNKYSEGYPNKRYYGGNEFIDRIELETQDRAKKLFNVPFVNVQPYSGSPANFAVYLATCNPGDTVMGLNLPDGGHLTHGWKVSATALFYKSVPYHVTEDGRLDIDEVWKLAKEHKPKLIWTGATAYVYEYDFASFAEIADSVGAYLASDIAHIAGLVVGGAHVSPVPYAHIVTTTTHKTLRGPRGGMIMVTEKGLNKDPELGMKIDKAIFPGFQGGPHNHQTAAIGIALGEDSTKAFSNYAHQIVKNAKTLGETLKKRGISLVGNGTENHMLLLNLVPLFGPGGGAIIEKGLDAIGLTVNKNTIPKDPSSPYYPSGIRLGTPAATTRKMKEKEMVFVGNKIADLIEHMRNEKLPAEKEKRAPYLKDLTRRLRVDTWIAKTFKETVVFAKRFPLP